MKKLIITLIVMFTIACNFASLPVVTKARYIQVVYAYKVNSDQGVQFAILANNVASVYDYSESVLPTFEYVRGLEILRPVTDMRFSIQTDSGDKFEKGKTDYSGHLILRSKEYLTLVSYEEEKYTCVTRNQWQTHDQLGNPTGGGAVLQCNVNLGINP